MGVQVGGSRLSFARAVSEFFSIRGSGTGAQSSASVAWRRSNLVSTEAENVGGVGVNGAESGSSFRGSVGHNSTEFILDIYLLNYDVTEQRAVANLYTRGAATRRYFVFLVDK